MTYLLPALLIAATAAILYPVLTREGGLTLRLVLPPGVHVVVDQPYSVAATSLPVSQPPAAAAQLPRARETIPEPDKSILRSILSLDVFGDYAAQVIRRKETQFARIPSSQHALMSSLGYPAQLSAAQDAVAVNKRFSQQIAQYARELYNFRPGQEVGIKDDLDMVHDAFAHIVRDWSAVGKKDRAQMFPPILNALQSHLANVKGPKKVFVPGFGLGRLAHEIAELDDYSVTANDIDYTSILTYNYIVNQTTDVFEHTFHPFVLKWTQQLDASSRFQEVKIPDYIPSSKSKRAVKVVGGDFLKAFPADEYHGKYDAVVTLFFIDVGENIIDFLTKIRSLLKEGGIWINLGPLKWGSFADVQLSADEVLALAEALGFDINHPARQSVDVLYGHQPDSLLKYTYATQFWTGTKHSDKARL